MMGRLMVGVTVGVGIAALEILGRVLDFMDRVTGEAR